MTQPPLPPRKPPARSAAGPRCARSLLSRAGVVRARRASRPLSFPPCRLDGQAIPVGWTGKRFLAAGRDGNSCRLDGQTIPGGWTGWRFLSAGRDGDSCRLDGQAIPASKGQPHASPADSLVRASGTHPLIPRTIWLAAACGPSLRSGRAGDTRASARRPHSTPKIGLALQRRRSVATRSVETPIERPAVSICE